MRRNPPHPPELSNISTVRLALLYHQFVVRGGLEGYLWEFASRLRGRGHELVLVGSRLDARFRSLAAEVQVIPPPPVSSAWLLARFARRSARLIRGLRADAVLGFGRTHCQDIHRAGGGCHAVYSRSLPILKRWRCKNRLELSVERRLYTGGGTRHFVVNSTMVARELQREYRVPPDAISVIHTGVDADHWHPAADDVEKGELRRKLSPATPMEMPVWLFVSLDHRRKGLASLLQAACEVPGAEIWIVGAPLDRGWWKCIDSLGLRSRVRAFGRQEDLRAFYQAADLFVHPTAYDACANTVLQSMASGLPGIISERDGAAEFIRERQNGFLLTNPDNPRELAARLREAAACNLPTLGRGARASMLPLNWDAHMDAWMELIQRTAVSRGPG